MVFFLNLVKEATYVFEFKGKTQKIDAYIDTVDNRRWVGNYITSLTYLNYRGTGNEYQELYPTIIHESEPVDLSSWQKNVQFITFKLPDVDAFAVGTYMEEHEFEEPSILLHVNLIDTI